MVEVVAVCSTPSCQWRVPSFDTGTRRAARLRKVDVVKACLIPQVVQDAAAAGIDLGACQRGVVLGIAVLASDFCYDGFKNLNRQQQAQYLVYRKLRGRSLDGQLFFFEVDDRITFDPPLEISSFAYRHQKSFFGVIDSVQLDLIKERLDNIADDARPAWLVNPTAVLQLPVAFAYLLMQGGWSSLGVCNLRVPCRPGGWSIGWRLRYVGRAANILFEHGFGSNPFEVKPDIVALPALDPNVLTRVLQHVRALTDVIDHNANHVCLEELYSYVVLLQDHVDDFLECMVGHDDGDVGQHSNRAYNVRHLINCFVLSGLLRNDRDMKGALTTAARVVVPQGLAPVIEQCIRVGQLGRDIPSPTTLNRVRGRIDVSWMLLWRDRLRQWLPNGISIYIGVDGSPMGGRDYEVVLLDLVKDEDLPGMLTKWGDIASVMQMADIDEQMQLIEEQYECMDWLRQRIRTHTAPSVQLGMGKNRASLALKFSAIVHSLFLLAPTLWDLEAITKSIVTWVTDYGTERSLGRIKKISIDKVLPFLATAMQEEDFGAGQVQDEDFGGDMAKPEVDLTSSLDTPGMLHVISNATKDLKKSMTMYSDMVQNAKAVADLCRRKESCDRLIATCFSDSIGMVLQADIRAFHGHIYLERWGTVADCVPRLLKIRAALTSRWSIKKYNDGDVAAARRQDDPDVPHPHSVRLDIADAAITSPGFWAYMLMLNVIAEVLDRLLHWIEGCSCHWSADWDSAPFKLRQLWKKCPLRGRRCPELAAGDFLQEATRLLDMGSARLSCLLGERLSGADRMGVLVDFESGRYFLLYYFTLKTSFWTAPPWRIFAMAHVEPRKALEAYEVYLGSLKAPLVRCLSHLPSPPKRTLPL